MRRLIALILLGAATACGGNSDPEPAVEQGKAPADTNGKGNGTADAGGPSPAKDPESESLPSLPGEEVVTGKVYEGGTQLRASTFGVAFKLPDGLRTAIGDEGFVVEGAGTFAHGVILMRQKATADAIRAEMSQPQDMGEGVVLHPEADVEETGGTLRCWYTDGMYVALCAARIGEHGNATAFLLGAESSNRDWVSKRVDAFSDSVKFAAPQESQSEKEWRQLLAGHRLSYRKSHYDGDLGGSSSSSTRIEIALAADGTFAYSFYDSFTVGTGGDVSGAYGQAKDRDQGKWSLELTGAAVQLVLEGENERRRYTLAYAQGKVYLDGKQYYRTPLQ